MGITVEMKEGKETPPEVAQKPAEVVVQTKPSEEPKYVKYEDLEKINQSINNTREYNTRKLDEINKRLEALAPKPIATGDPDLDELVQKDWKAGVRQVARMEYEDQLRKNQEANEAQRTGNILEESKAKVMAKHPELNDPSNPKTIEFLKVLDENPDYKMNPRGPILAAYEMENRIKGHDTIESRETKVDKTTRARATSVPQGTSTGQKAGYTLTKVDMDFCKHNNINPENYKRFKGQTEARV